MNPKTVADIQEYVRSQPGLAVRGGGTKTALGAPDGVALIEMGALAGMMEYSPGEFTFTALAGTPVQEVAGALALHGQFLPFDPLLVQRGATLGGTVASGLSGPGRYRFGGVRDFILGVRFVDGQANLVSGGGKVVKNAAGFDLPKLMVGSLGQLGVLVELTFKVFPRPQACLTQSFACPSLDSAVAAINDLARRPLELLALELDLGAAGAVLHIRLGGAAGTLAARRQRLGALAGLEPAGLADGEAEAAFWQRRGEFAWVPPDWLLVKVPITPRQVVPLDRALAEAGAMRQYSAGLSQAWVAWPAAPDDLGRLLLSQGLSGLAVLGPPGGPPFLGVLPDQAFIRRVRLALDPQGKLDRYAAHYSR